MEVKTFERLIFECEDTLYRVSMSLLKNEHDAQDAVHDAIIKAYENLHKLRREEFFKTWLVRITINECKRVLRQKSRFTDSCDVIFDVSSRDNPYVSLEIGEAIDSLPQKIRLVMIMYYVEDYSIKEIKQVLNIPEGTVKSRLNKGRALLKEKLI